MDKMDIVQHLPGGGITIKYDGLVRFEKLVRLPILGRGNKKVIAVLSNFYDLTHRLTLNKLFQFYRDYYPEKQAIQQLLKHLKIDHYFSELPTLSEVWLLFALHQDPRQKGAARLLGLSHKTVYVYVTHLRDKLRVPDLHTVLAQLRAVPIRPDHIRLESERRLDGQHTRGRKLDSHRLNAAKALLAEGMTFKNVAQQVGVSVSTLYRWFSDKKTETAPYPSRAFFSEIAAGASAR
ncbi:helix-turn-helix domain-containing protein [Candidatus Glomeribacter gigasporarum]|nr:helix-turn-helix domain-containing protein [Candidatus Glomeribacter gigasporarum]